MKDRYLLLSSLSEDPIGHNFLAQDLKMEREVVIRRLFPGLESHAQEQLRGAFLQIVGQLSGLKSQALQQVIDGGYDEESCYLVLEKLNGPLLTDAIADRTLDLESFEQLSQDLLSTLAELHAHRMLHGALSASSIQLHSRTLGGMIYKLVDLGMGSMTRFATGKSPEALGFINEYLLAPEILSGQQPTPESEQYNCGQLFYECLVSCHPYKGFSRDQLERHANLGNIPLVHELNPEVPEKLSLWIARLIAPDPDDRFPSIAVALQKRPRIPSHRIRLIATEKNLTALARHQPHSPLPNQDLPHLPSLKQPSRSWLIFTAFCLLAFVTYLCYRSGLLKF